MNYILAYKIHAWTGLLLSPIVLVLSISGMIILFQDELQLWEQPILQDITLSQQKPLNENTRLVLSQFNLDPNRTIHIKIPNNTSRSLRFEIPLLNLSQKKHIDINPVSQNILTINNYQLSQFFREIHTRLLLFSPVGNYLVGLLGFAMMLSITAGILLHKDFFKAFLTFRFRKSARLLISDSHKLLGLWALVFHIMITVTGGTIGISHALEIFTFEAATKIESRHEIVESERQLFSSTTQLSEMANLDAVLQDAQKELPKSSPYSLVLHRWNFSDAQIVVRSKLAYELSRFAELRYDGVSGKLEDQYIYSKHAGAFSRIFEAMITLHFADYLNFWLKLGYFLLAVSMTVLAISGALLWQEGRRERNSVSNSFNKAPQLMLGLQLGFIYSTVLLFLAHKIIVNYLPTNISIQLLTTLFLLFWIIFILVSLLARDTKRLLQHTIIQMSGLLMLIVTLNIFTLFQKPFELVNHQDWPIYVPDIFLASFSIIFFIIWKLIRRKNI